jgi:predicted Zn-dependent protease
LIINRIGLGLAVALTLAAAGADVRARSGGISIVRDAETEHIIRELAAPVLQAAGLEPAAVRIHLVHDNALNAFVAGGQRIFVTTGLLRRVESPNQLLGVIAHETGHIASGHLSRLPDAMRNASAQTIVSFLLGAAAMVAGSPEAGAAIISGGQHVAQRSLLQFTRTQESAADQSALLFLDGAGQSGRGLVDFLKILGDQEALLAESRDPYARTHPVSNERTAALRSRVEQSRHAAAGDTTAQRARLERMQAKLIGYFDDLETVLRRYPPSDSRPAARYARAMGYFRAAELTKALAEIDNLLAQFADDPYLHELKGQMLFENGRIDAALASNRAAVRFAPGEPLLRVALAQNLIATEDPAMNQEAIGHLVEAGRIEPHNSLLWQQLAVAHGRAGDFGNSALANAERFLLEGNGRDARHQADRAQRMLPQGSPGWLRAADILDATRREGQPEKRG